jgi:hypothetical protein
VGVTRKGYFVPEEVKIGTASGSTGSPFKSAAGKIKYLKSDCFYCFD